ncbi:hypothetical protein BDZ94DRAFT_1273534 [Collybia nuda]|uniref:Uncharacterized protein n=1 Tax=Collybia nuda TaxID=64659 RepID=A0A9P5XV14_9AGAR|nr:hypothetical protein BDZ94DRAFT_1273534 [Collybia nuda]
MGPYHSFAGHISRGISPLNTNISASEKCRGHKKKIESYVTEASSEYLVNLDSSVTQVIWGSVGFFCLSGVSISTYRQRGNKLRMAFNNLRRKRNLKRLYDTR